MDVLIKGMKMPKACINCDVHIAHDYCDHFAQFGTGARTDGRYDDCPLVEIVKCEECEWSNGECSVGERYQGGCTFGLKGE